MFVVAVVFTIRALFIVNSLFIKEFGAKRSETLREVNAPAL
jgi:hypothetical protein